MNWEASWLSGTFTWNVPIRVHLTQIQVLTVLQFSPPPFEAKRGSKVSRHFQYTAQLCSLKKKYTSRYYEYEYVSYRDTTFIVYACVMCKLYLTLSIHASMYACICVYMHVCMHTHASQSTASACTATHCNTLQHSTTHSKTLQHMHACM